MIGGELFERVVRDPAAPPARSIYADWLAETGQPVASRFLRLEDRWLVDPVPGPMLLELSQLAESLDPAWACAVSAVRAELRRLLRQFAAAVPWACDPASLGDRAWPESEPLRAFFASKVGTAASRFCWPLDHRLQLTLAPGIGSTTRGPPRAGDRVGDTQEVVERTLEQGTYSDLPVPRLVGRGLWVYAETDEWGRPIFVSADATRQDFGAARRSAAHPWFRLRFAPQAIRQTTLARWRHRVTRFA